MKNIWEIPSSMAIPSSISIIMQLIFVQYFCYSTYNLNNNSFKLNNKNIIQNTLHNKVGMNNDRYRLPLKIDIPSWMYKTTKNKFLDFLRLR
jgi:hypothetical protein